MASVKLRRGFKADAERTALRFRTELKLKNHDHLCAFQLAEHLGIEVLNHADCGITPAQVVEIGRDKSGWSALTLKNGDDVNIIIHNSHHTIARQQSNLMHEIAHIVCKHELPPIPLLPNCGFPMRTYDAIIETEAEWLGGCLQIPKDGLVWAMEREMSRSEVAEHFNASEQMALYRYNMTGMKKQFWKSEAFFFIND